MKFKFSITGLDCPNCAAKLSANIEKDEKIEKAKKMGYDAIEFTDLEVPEGQTEIEFARAVKAEAHLVGIEISGYSVSADLLS